MIIMDENFLVDAGSRYRIDKNLPYRLQKRELARTLGFPSNDRLKACNSSEHERVEELIAECCALGYPFLIIVSEKPMATLVPPLFTVNGVNSVNWRDCRGEKCRITVDAASRIIRDYPKDTWLEFSPLLWNPLTIAGRLAYMSSVRQVLEIQQGTLPAKLIDDKKLLTYMGELNFLDLERCQYLESRRWLESRGYPVCPFNIVRFVCKRLQPLFSGLEALLDIAKIPTLEFALTETNQLIVVDIDWPEQFIEKEAI